MHLAILHVGDAAAKRCRLWRFNMYVYDDFLWPVSRCRVCPGILNFLIIGIFALQKKLRHRPIVSHHLLDYKVSFFLKKRHKRKKYKKMLRFPVFLAHVRSIEIYCYYFDKIRGKRILKLTQLTTSMSNINRKKVMQFYFWKLSTLISFY